MCHGKTVAGASGVEISTTPGSAHGYSINSNADADGCGC